MYLHVNIYTFSRQIDEWVKKICKSKERQASSEWKHVDRQLEHVETRRLEWGFLNQDLPTEPVEAQKLQRKYINASYIHALLNVIILSK